MKTQTTSQKSMGVLPDSHITLDPRQRKFIGSYLDAESDTFANCYQSAVKAGFSDQTARNLTHNKPKWYSESLGQTIGAQPEHLLIRLTEIANSSTESTQNRLKAIDMLMKSKGMYQSTQNNFLKVDRINIETVLN